MILCGEIQLCGLLHYMLSSVSITPFSYFFYPLKAKKHPQKERLFHIWAYTVISNQQGSINRRSSLAYTVIYSMRLPQSTSSNSVATSRRLSSVVMN